jgi:hypothetical protein
VATPPATRRDSTPIASGNHPQRRFITERQCRRIQVTRIETVAMTTTEYEDAVEALAILIARYWDDHPGTGTA